MAGLYIFTRDSQQYYAWEKPEIPATPLYAWKNGTTAYYTKTETPTTNDHIYLSDGYDLYSRDETLASVEEDYSKITVESRDGSTKVFSRDSDKDTALPGSPAKIYYTTSSTPNENDTVYVKIAGEMIETTKVNSYKPETPNLYAWHGEYKGSGERT